MTMQTPDIEEISFSIGATEGAELNRIRITPEQRLFQALEWGRHMIQGKIIVRPSDTCDRIEIDYGR